LLYQNDDGGKDYLTGLKEGLGARAAGLLVSEASYEPVDPTVDSQVVRLKAAGVDLLIRKAAELDWKPVHLLGVGSSSIDAVLAAAGLNNSRGLISASSFKEASDPTWIDDEGMKKWVAFMNAYYPEGDRKSIFTTFGYSAAELMVHVLRQCGDDISRENVMQQAANVKNLKLDLLLPGLSINTSRSDYRVVKEFRMMRFNGERWEPFGPIVAD
jgi:hypothetical protein